MEDDNKGMTPPGNEQPADEREAKFRPYRIAVNTPALNVREGAGYLRKVLRTLTGGKKEHYTVTAEASDEGGNTWCRIEPGEGWVAKEFVKRVK